MEFKEEYNINMLSSLCVNPTVNPEILELGKSEIISFFLLCLMMPALPAGLHTTYIIFINIYICIIDVNNRYCLYKRKVLYKTTPTTKWQGNNLAIYIYIYTHTYIDNLFKEYR